MDGADQKQTVGEFPYTPAALDAAQAYDLYKQKQQQCPVTHGDTHGGFHTLARYKDVRAAAMDWERFSSGQGVGLESRDDRVPALEMDPPEHAAWHKLQRLPDIALAQEGMDWKLLGASLATPQALRACFLPR